MNRETLEYLGRKVDKARQLQEQIQLVKAAVHYIKRFTENSIVIKGDYVNDKGWHSGDKVIRLCELLDFDSLDKVKNAVADVLTEFGEKLEKEFEEL